MAATATTEKGGVSTGAITAMVVAPLMVLVLILAVCWWYFRRRAASTAAEQARPGSHTWSEHRESGDYPGSWASYWWPASGPPEGARVGNRVEEGLGERFEMEPRPGSTEDRPDVTGGDDGAGAGDEVVRLPPAIHPAHHHVGSDNIPGWI